MNPDSALYSASMIKRAKRSRRYVRSQNRVGRGFSFMQSQRLSLWNNPYCFIKQVPGLQTFVTNAVSGNVANYSFFVSQVPELVALGSYFQFYRIDMVELLYRPLISVVEVKSSDAAVSTLTPPNVFVSDNHYSAALVNYNQLKSRGDARTIASIKSWNHAVIPNPLIRAYDSIVTDGFLNLGPQWLSTAQLDVPHYGIALGIEPSVGPGPEFGGNLEVIFKVSFLNPT